MRRRARRNGAAGRRDVARRRDRLCAPCPAVRCRGAAGGAGGPDRDAALREPADRRADPAESRCAPGRAAGRGLRRGTALSDRLPFSEERGGRRDAPRALVRAISDPRKRLQTSTPPAARRPFHWPTTGRTRCTSWSRRSPDLLTSPGMFSTSRPRGKLLELLKTACPVRSGQGHLGSSSRAQVAARSTGSKNALGLKWSFSRLAPDVSGRRCQVPRTARQRTGLAGIARLPGFRTIAEAATAARLPSIALHPPFARVGGADGVQARRSGSVPTGRADGREDPRGATRRPPDRRPTEVLLPDQPEDSTRARAPLPPPLLLQADDIISWLWRRSRVRPKPRRGPNAKPRRRDAHTSV